MSQHSLAWEKAMFEIQLLKRVFISSYQQSLTPWIMLNPPAIPNQIKVLNCGSSRGKSFH